MVDSVFAQTLSPKSGPRDSPVDVDATLALLGSQDYVADRRLATAVFLALKLRRPLFLEGEAGVGKTEIAKVIASGLHRNLVRLQCYEGLDTAAAVYEWNYPRQMIEIRLAEAAGVSRQSVNELLRGRRAVSPEMALRLGRLFGNSPEFWMNAQRSVDLYDAAQRLKDEVGRIKPLRVA